MSGGSRLQAYVVFFILAAMMIRLPLALRPLSATSDPWREADTASIARNFYISPQPNILYPQINWGGNGPGYVEAEFQLFPYITSLLYRLFGENEVLGRFVSLVFNILTCVIFYLLARRLSGERAAFWALFFFAIAPLSVRYGTAFMPEATMFFFYISALYLFVRWLDDRQDRYLWLAAISTALSILVKPTSIIIGLTLFLLLFERYKLRIVIQPKLWLFAVIALAPPMLWFLHARSLFLTYGNTFGVISGGDSKFGNLSYWLDPGFYQSLIQLDVIYVFAGVSFLLFIPGLIIYLRQRQPSLMLYSLVVIVPYYLLLARYTGNTAGLQYHIFALTFAALGSGIGMTWLLDRMRQQAVKWPTTGRRLMSAGAVLACLAVPAIAYERLFIPRTELLAECGMEASNHIPEGNLVVVSTNSSSTDKGGVPNNYQEPQIFYYSNRYGWSLPADRHTPSEVYQLQTEGAAYMVVYDPTLLTNNPALAYYLERNAALVGHGFEHGCLVYRFNDTLYVNHDSDISGS
jgi:4-amino-4-deoxy-L-arabinose transferase-like glycosyltransferase